MLDIDFGEWQGLTPEEVRGRYPDLLRAWFEEPHAVQIPGGESLAIVRDRVTRGLRNVVERHRGQAVAMVGHMVINRVLLCAVLGLGNDRFWRLRQDTCGVNVFDVDPEGQATIIVLNDTCHLRHLVD
jgi:broad specificity phosphatase PhoE